MKAILLSIRPEWLVKILNGEKTIEVRKLFPKDYVGWVYLYCSKSNTQYLVGSKTQKCEIITKSANAIFSPNIDKYTGNGKVVARFWCDKVEEMRFEDNGGFYETALQRYEDSEYFTDSLIEEEICEKSCLECYELEEYLKGKKGFAIHISDLEIFDKPRELSEFYKGFRNKYYKREFGIDTHIDKYGVMVQPTKNGYEYTHKLTKAPQNYCYIEGE